MDWGKFIRQVSLVILIISALAFVIICWVAYAQIPYMIVPAVCFTGIYVWVILNEIWGAISGEKKTLSTRWKWWATQHPVLSWSALLLFWLAMTALVFHLGVYW